MPEYKQTTKKHYVREDVRKDEARRLSALWQAAKSDTRYPLTQSQFGEKYEIGGQAAVQQLLTGKRPLNIDQAIKFADYLRCPIGRFSPRIEAILEKYLATINSCEYNDLLSVLTPERADLWRKFAVLEEHDQNDIAKTIQVRYETMRRILERLAPPSSQERLLRLSTPNQTLDKALAE